MKKQLDLSAIRKISFPKHQYIKEEHNKRQIFLHHTASGRGTDGDFRHWLNTKGRIATCVIVDYKGVIHQCFSSMYWGYHLGIRGGTFREHEVPYQLLDKSTIGIEIDSWGGLKHSKEGKWFTYTGKELHDDRVVVYPEGYRGYRGFERYTEEQIETVRLLLLYWNNRYDIPLDYNEDMWDVSKRALSGEKGIWSHCSVRPDKSDVSPQPELIDMLKSLKTIKKEK